MPPQAIHITPADLSASEEDRFDRFRRISWWDQQKLSAAKVLVIGAGALGNEIIKNLALLGVGNLFIADMDRIENSNLSRSVLYRAEDTGRSKAQVAAAAARAIYPQINTQAFDGNVVYDLGMGVFRWADVILGGLDNREARLAINRAAWKVNRPWIDGAIEQIEGMARVFVPDGPCYECTMSDLDWKLLQSRRSCNLLSKAEMERGKTPTTPTISSIIAGVQCQEAVKLLHGIETIRGHGWVFQGLSADSYQIEFQRKPDCYSHDILDEVVAVDASADSMTLQQLLDEARSILGPEAELEFARDMLEKLVCPRCHAEEPLFVSMGKVSANQAFCPHCPTVRREVVMFYKLRPGDPRLAMTPAQIGLPPFDIIIGRTPERAIGLELAGDAAKVLGPLADQESLDWA